MATLSMPNSKSYDPLKNFLVQNNIGFLCNFRNSTRKYFLPLLSFFNQINDDKKNFILFYQDIDILSYSRKIRSKAK
jgi:hypothetical protein